jgi:hypothetical protein
MATQSSKYKGSISTRDDEKDTVKLNTRDDEKDTVKLNIVSASAAATVRSKYHNDSEIEL